VELNDKQRALKERFIANRGYWPDPWTPALEVDPDWLDAYERQSHAPSKRMALDPKLREFVGIAIDASATHMYADGIRVHVRGALQAGASTAEIMEVLEIVGEIGFRSATLGAAIIAELRGPQPSADPERAAELKRRFTAARDDWSEEWEQLLAMDPDFFEPLLDLLLVPRTSGHLEPKARALVALAVDVAITHMDVAAVRRDIAAAFAAGATADEVLGVCESVSGLGTHAIAIATPILAEEVQAHTKEPTP
jgi:alkylhydroperoxidase/carboxymuconolactone decarboxylase family protein YurZ